MPLIGYWGMKEHLIIKPEFSLEEAWQVVHDELKRASLDPKHPFRYVWLSTVDTEGQPNSRTVVFRKMSDDNKILIYTDIRSEKAIELNHNPKVTLLFYNNRKRLQVKMKGLAHLHHQDQISEREWNQSGHRGAHSYTSKIAPGTTLEKTNEAYEWNLEDPSNFCVIEIEVKEMEFLQLNGNEHLRSSKIGNEMKWIAP